MTPMLLSDLLRGWVAYAPDLSITGLSLDNRNLQPGMVFVALRGTQQHGLIYALSAAAAGAVAILYEPEENLNLPSLDIPLIPVEHLRANLGLIAARFYAKPSQALFMVGVTGTDGKTSVTHFIAEALNAAQADSAAVIGTLGLGAPGLLQTATHTTPDAISVQKALANLQAQNFTSVAMEVSSHALDQGRVQGVEFDVAVLTNLTRDHLDYHGTVAAYAEAKRKLFHWANLKAVVLNLDDAFGKQLAAEMAAQDLQVIGYGVGTLADYPTDSLVATDAVFDHSGIQATVHWQGQQAALTAPVLGQFNLHNLLAALGTLLAKGIAFTQAVKLLQHVWVVPGRMERVATAKAAETLVVVDYAHTPGALVQVLNAVRAHTKRRLICVFGCGGDRDRGKRPLMAQTAQENADFLIITDDNPRTESAKQIFGDIMGGIQPNSTIPVTWEHDRAQAIRLAIQQAQAGDTVLIAGKGHETVQILADHTVPFDDRVQAAQALKEFSL